MYKYLVEVVREFPKQCPFIKTDRSWISGNSKEASFTSSDDRKIDFKRAKKGSLINWPRRNGKTNGIKKYFNFKHHSLYAPKQPKRRKMYLVYKIIQSRIFDPVIYNLTPDLIKVDRITRINDYRTHVGYFSDVYTEKKSSYPVCKEQPALFEFEKVWKTDIVVEDSSLIKKSMIYFRNIWRNISSTDLTEPLTPPDNYNSQPIITNVCHVSADGNTLKTRRTDEKEWSSPFTQYDRRFKNINKKLEIVQEDGTQLIYELVDQVKPNAPNKESQALVNCKSEQIKATIKTLDNIKNQPSRPTNISPAGKIYPGAFTNVIRGEATEKKLQESENSAKEKKIVSNESDVMSKLATQNEPQIMKQNKKNYLKSTFKNEENENTNFIMESKKLSSSKHTVEDQHNEISATHDVPLIKVLNEKNVKSFKEESENSRVDNIKVKNESGENEHLEVKTPGDEPNTTRFDLPSNKNVNTYHPKLNHDGGGRVVEYHTREENINNTETDFSKQKTMEQLPRSKTFVKTGKTLMSNEISGESLNHISNTVNDEIYLKKENTESSKVEGLKNISDTRNETFNKIAHGEVVPESWNLEYIRTVEDEQITNLNVHKEKDFTETAPLILNKSPKVKPNSNQLQTKDDTKSKKVQNRPTKKDLNIQCEKDLKTEKVTDSENCVQNKDHGSKIGNSQAIVKNCLVKNIKTDVEFMGKGNVISNRKQPENLNLSFQEMISEEISDEKRSIDVNPIKTTYLKKNENPKKKTTRKIDKIKSVQHENPRKDLGSLSNNVKDNDNQVSKERITVPSQFPKDTDNMATKIPTSIEAFTDSTQDAAPEPKNLKTERKTKFLENLIHTNYKDRIERKRTFVKLSQRKRQSTVVIGESKMQNSKSGLQVLPLNSVEAETTHGLKKGLPVNDHSQLTCNRDRVERNNNFLKSAQNDISKVKNVRNLERSESSNTESGIRPINRIQDEAKQEVKKTIPVRKCGHSTLRKGSFEKQITFEKVVSKKPSAVDDKSPERKTLKNDKTESVIEPLKTKKRIKIITFTKNFTDSTDTADVKQPTVKDNTQLTNTVGNDPTRGLKKEPVTFDRKSNKNAVNLMSEDTLKRTYTVHERCLKDTPRNKTQFSDMVKSADGVNSNATKEKLLNIKHTEANQNLNTTSEDKYSELRLEEFKQKMIKNYLTASKNQSKEITEKQKMIENSPLLYKIDLRKVQTVKNLSAQNDGRRISQNTKIENNTSSSQSIQNDAKSTIKDSLDNTSVKKSFSRIAPQADTRNQITFAGKESKIKSTTDGANEKKTEKAMIGKKNYSLTNIEESSMSKNSKNSSS